MCGCRFLSWAPRGSRNDVPWLQTSSTESSKLPQRRSKENHSSLDAFGFAADSAPNHTVASMLVPRTPPLACTSWPCPKLPQKARVASRNCPPRGSVVMELVPRPCRQSAATFGPPIVSDPWCVRNSDFVILHRTYLQVLRECKRLQGVWET